MMRKGDYVLCNFPFRETEGPAPSLHTVLVSGTARVGTTPMVVVFYTTSQVGFPGGKRPRHLIHVDENRSRELGQAKAFDTDVTRLALLPITPDYFLEVVDGAVPNRGQDPHVAQVAERRLAELKAAVHEVELTKRHAPSPGLKIWLRPVSPHGLS